MPQRATRNGATVKLPKYRNAEMLLLEYFEGKEIVIEKLKTGSADSLHLALSWTDGNLSVSDLESLLYYINANI